MPSLPAGIIHHPHGLPEVTRVSGWKGYTLNIYLRLDGILHFPRLNGWQAPGPGDFVFLLFDCFWPSGYGFLHASTRFANRGIVSFRSLASRTPQTRSSRPVPSYIHNIYIYIYLYIYIYIYIHIYIHFAIGWHERGAPRSCQSKEIMLFIDATKHKQRKHFLLLMQHSTNIGPESDPRPPTDTLQLHMRPSIENTAEKIT